MLNTIIIQCDDCRHMTETSDRDLIGSGCTFCGGTYRRKWTPVASPLRAASDFYKKNY